MVCSRLVLVFFANVDPFGSDLVYMHMDLNIDVRPAPSEYLHRF